MGKLSSEDKRKYQIVSRILGILMRIANVCCWIGVAGLILATSIVAVVAPNVKVNSEAKEITLFDEKVSYDVKDKTIEFGNEDAKVVVEKNEVRVDTKNGTTATVKLSDADIDKIEDFIEDDMLKLLSALPYILMMAVVALIFVALALGHGASVFKNIAKEKTPFTEENVERCEKSAKYLIISFVLATLTNVVMSIITDGKSGVTIGGSITAILGLYVVIYILKSGVEAEGKKTTKTDKAFKDEEQDEE
jgi:hypothetical protein